MLQSFCIIHRRKPLQFEVGAFPVWATCLRSLAFVNSPAQIAADPKDEVYIGVQAYQFLLEIVCGLHSPIVGETEVFGQFKNFLPELLNHHPERAALMQKLLGDAKLLRSKYLSKLGNQSYGSWLRKNVGATEVHILGGGQLVREVLPYLAKQGKQVTVHVRDPRKVDFHNEARAIKAKAFGEGALIIAAPMSAQEIGSWLGDRDPAQIFDLRDNSCTDRVNRNGEHTGLRAIFDEIALNKTKLRPVIEKVRAGIIACAEKLNHQAVMRPQGWDDLCA